MANTDDMETKIAALVFLLMVVSAPVASAGLAVPLPKLVDTCLSSPLATCVDSVSPRVKASRLLPDAFVPDTAPAPAPAPEPAPRTDAEPAADAAAPAAASGAEPEAGAPPVDAASEADAGRGDNLAQRALLSLVVLLAILGLLVVVLVLDASRPRAPKRARAPTLRDGLRARAMQKDIDDAWREARAHRAP